MGAHLGTMRKIELAVSKAIKARCARTITVFREPLERISEKAVKSLTNLIIYHGRKGEVKKAFKVFNDMSYKNQITWNVMLTMLLDLGSLDSARRLFEEMPQRNLISYTSMITGFSKLGFVTEARMIFDSVPFSDQSVISWTAMISCYEQNCQSTEALKLFSDSYGIFFSFKVIPNSYTFTILLKSCSSVGSIVIASQVHAVIVKTLDQEDKESIYVQNSLIDLHSKLGNLVDGKKIFDILKWKDLSSWNTMMAAYAHHLEVDKALRIFYKMKKKDVLSWNIVISGLADSGRGEEALELFLYLLRSWPETKPNPSSFTIILTVCATLTALELGKQIHACTIKLGFDRSNVFTGNSLINMYAQCGSLEESEKVFNAILKKDVVSVNSFILGLGQNGSSRKALDIAEEALKLKIYNYNTFIGILMSCSHGGLVDEGMKFFSSMSTEYGIEPSLDHYICVIDMLGRAGKVSEAYDLLCRMPFVANSVAWAALLGACLAHGNGEVGEIAAERLRMLEPDNVASYVMLANIYGRTGRMEESRVLLNLMGEKGLKKEPGCSWILEI